MKTSSMINPSTSTATMTREELLERATGTNTSVLLRGKQDPVVNQLLNSPTYTEFVCEVRGEDEINVLHVV